MFRKGILAGAVVGVALYVIWRRSQTQGDAGRAAVPAEPVATPASVVPEPAQPAPEAAAEPAPEPEAVAEPRARAGAGAAGGRDLVADTRPGGAQHRGARTPPGAAHPRRPPPRPDDSRLAQGPPRAHVLGQSRRAATRSRVVAGCERGRQAAPVAASHGARAGAPAGVQSATAGMISTGRRL